MDPDTALAEIRQEAGEHKRPLGIGHFSLLHITEHHEPSISTGRTTLVRAGDVFDDHVATFVRLERFVQKHLLCGPQSPDPLIYRGCPGIVGKRLGSGRG
jgi:hypothetical protein